MNRIPLFVLIILLIAFGTPFAQNAQQGAFGFYGTLALPSGDFGDDQGADAGGAKTGFGAGAEFALPIGQEGLSWVTSGTFILNGLDDALVEAATEDIAGFFDPNWGIDAGRWVNIPILSGLKYQGPASPTLDIYGMGMVGLNIAKGPSAEVSDENGDLLGELSLNTATSFGFGIGGGIVINEKINVGMRFYSLGEPEFEVTLEDADGNQAEFEQELPVSLILIIVGINL